MEINTILQHNINLLVDEMIRIAIELNRQNPGYSLSTCIYNVAHEADLIMTYILSQQSKI